MRAHRTIDPNSGSVSANQRNLQAVFGIGGVAIGAVAGLVAYRLSGSWALPCLCFCSANT